MEVVPAEGERCKRTGTNWRCPVRVLPGKNYCEKHHLYNISRNNRRKNKMVSGEIPAVKNSVFSSASAAVEPKMEPYRPVLDFSAAEIGGYTGGGGGNVGCSALDGEEIIGWLLGGGVDDGGNDGNSLGSIANDRFTLPEPGIVGGFPSRFGKAGCSNDDSNLSEPGGGESVRVVGPFGGNCNDGFTPDHFSEGNKCFLSVETANREVCEKQVLGISGMRESLADNKILSFGRGVEGQIGEVGCTQNVIVCAMEAKTGQGQKRKRGRIGSKTIKI